MNPQTLDPRSLRPLAWPLYAVAAMLVLIPLSELAAQLGWTVQPGQLNWRTGAVGLLSSVVVTPTFGLLLGLITAFIFEHRWAQRILTAVAGLAALLTLAVLVVFALDALQLRTNVRVELQRSYMVAVVKAVINFSIAGVTLASIAFAGFRAGRQRARALPAAEKRSGRTDLPLARVAQH